MRPHELIDSSCASCGAALTLACEPTQGFWGYKTYNEYSCPQCGKRNVVLSPGAVLTSRPRDSAVGARLPAPATR